MADHFIYVPLIGLFLLLVWGTEELAHGWRKQRLVLTTVAVAVLVGVAPSPGGKPVIGKTASRCFPAP